MRLVLFDKELTDLRNDIAHTLSDTAGDVTLSVDEAVSHEAAHVLTDGHFAHTLPRVKHSHVINRVRRALT